MPSFGRRSRERLATCHPHLRSVLEAVMLSGRDDRDDDFTVLCGARGRAAQHEAKATGHSGAGWPDSRHNCPVPTEGTPRYEWPEDPNPESDAVDVAPWPIDWDDEIRFAVLAGRIQQEAANQGVKIRWGGTFKRLVDMPHHELED